MRSTDTKSRIIQASSTLFSTHGCEGTTIADIITATGITKGAFYHHFKSKEDLCEAILEQVILDYQKLVDSVEPGLEPIDALRQLLKRIAELNASGEWVNCRLILRLTAESHQHWPQLQSKIKDFWNWYISSFEILISRCRAAGQIKTDISPKLQARLALSIMVGAITLEKTGTTTPALAEMAETIIHCLQS